MMVLSSDALGIPVRRASHWMRASSPARAGTTIETAKPEGAADRGGARQRLHHGQPAEGLEEDGEQVHGRGEGGPPGPGGLQGPPQGAPDHVVQRPHDGDQQGHPGGDPEQAVAPALLGAFRLRGTGASARLRVGGGGRQARSFQANTAAPARPTTIDPSSTTRFLVSAATAPRAIETWSSATAVAKA